MKLLTFLGKADYKETEYTLDDNCYLTKYCSVAIAKFHKLDDILVVVTDGAKIMHLQSFTEEIMKLGLSQPMAVDIKDGRDENEIWEIFHALTKEVAEGDELIVDITNGFRSLPFLSFLAIAFLRMARKVKVQYVYYGVFEPTNPKFTKILNLTSFVALLDWTIATDRFIKTGNATDLANELHKANLNPLAETVENIATGLHLLRPQETSLAAELLPIQFDRVKTELPPPFTLLADSLLNSYSRFGKPNQTHARSQLANQLEIINWYYKCSQFVHALSLAREWVVSFLCWHFELEVDNEKNRADMELLVRGGEDKRTGDKSIYLNQWPNVPQYKRFGKLWTGQPNLPSLRNDLLHSGFRKNPRSSDKIKKDVDDVLRELNEIAQKCGF